MPSGVLFLAIETSSLRGALALFRGRECLQEVLFPEGLVHGREIALRLRELLEGQALGPGDLEGIAVSSGPGSYTGTRVGVTCAKTLAWALRLPVVEVSSLEVLARTALELGRDRKPATVSGARGPRDVPETGEVVPVLDARRGFFYTARFGIAGRDGPASRRSPDRLVRLDGLREVVAASEAAGGALLCGDGADLALDEIEEQARPGLRRAPRAADLPRACALGRVALPAMEQATFDLERLHRLEPAYLRPSEPEIVLERQRRSVEPSSPGPQASGGERR